MPAAPRLAVLTLLAVLPIAACTGHSTSTQAASESPASTSGLPPGYSRNPAAAPSAVATLTMAPTTKPVNAGTVHANPIATSAAVTRAVQALVNLPVQTHVQPLLTDTAPAAGKTVLMVGAKLAANPHDVRFTLTGPGGTYTHLIRAKEGIAAASVRIPSGLSQGTWYLAVEDIATATFSTTAKPTGFVTLDLTTFTVS